MVSFWLLLQIYSLVEVAAHVLNNRNPEIPSEPPVPTSAPNIQLKDNPSCLILGEALAICGSLTPDFKDLDPTAQAECLCYSSTAWAPSIFDSAAESCAAFASVSATSAYPALSNIQNFCTSIGDVVKQPASNIATTTKTAPTATSSVCSAMNSIISLCTMQTPGFTTLDEKMRAKCLCYSKTNTWSPTVFDAAVDNCSKAEATGEPDLLASASLLEGLCARVGNIAVETPVISLLSDSVLPTPSTTPMQGPVSLSPSGQPSTATDTHIISEVTVVPIPAPGPAAPTTSTPSTMSPLVSEDMASMHTHTTASTTKHITSTNTNLSKISAAAAGQSLMKVPETEVIIISLMCSLVLLFLC